MQKIKQLLFTKILRNAVGRLNAYLDTFPLQLTSIFLKRAVERNEGNLQISFVTDLNSALKEGN